MDDDKATSLHLYQYLCKLYGSPEVVKFRRTVYTAAEVFGANRFFQVIPSGSRSEGLEIEGSDIDIMHLDQRVTVHEKLSERYCKKDTVNIIMDHSETKLGFTRLLLPNMCYESEQALGAYRQLIKWSFKADGKNYISSSLVRDYMFQDGFTPHGPCLLFNKDDYIEIEALTCFRCKHWISLAHPWITRIRRSWPSQQLIDDITQYGVLFVPVGSKASNYERIEWRISFSIAERQLIYSFSHTQLLCYAMLKIVVSDIMKKQHGELLCSYFVKTIMFWLSEEHESNFWTPVNVAVCFMVCLQRLIYCVENRDCRHYFIPEINFFEERFNETNHKALLSSLYQVYCTGWRALFCTNTFQDFRSLTLRHPTYTSSILLPLLSIYVVFINPSFESLLGNLIGFSKFASKCTNKMMLYVLAMRCNMNVTNKNGSFIGNKQLYKQYKRLLPELLLNTRTDCVCGWCHLASLFYKLKLYRKCNYIMDYCLTKCTQDKIPLTPESYIILPVHIQNTICNSRWFSAILRHCIIDGVPFCSRSLLPEELTFLSDKKQVVYIPPVVYIYFLKFICAHHLRQEREKTMAFRGLQRTVRDEVFIMDDDDMLTAGKIVAVVDRLLHEIY